jgi:hypothetical protein
MPHIMSKEFFGEIVGVPASPTIVTKKAHAQVSVFESITEVPV